MIQLRELLSALLPPPKKFHSYQETEDTEELTEEEIEAHFVICIFYSFGSNLICDCQVVFDDFVKKLTGYSSYEDEDYNRAPFSKLFFFLQNYKNQQSAVFKKTTQFAHSYELWRPID